MQTFEIPLYGLETIVKVEVAHSDNGVTVRCLYTQDQLDVFGEDTLQEEMNKTLNVIFGINSEEN